MMVVGIVAVCVVLAVLAFFLPRLSRGPERGTQRTLGLGPARAARRPASWAASSASLSAAAPRPSAAVARPVAAPVATCPSDLGPDIRIRPRSCRMATGSGRGRRNTVVPGRSGPLLGVR